MIPSGIDIAGYWLGIFLTFCILCFLYKDNPFYKAAEHLFIGVSIGYVIIQQYTDNLKPKLVDHLHWQWRFLDNWWLLIPLALVGMMFTKAVSRKFAWVGRYPLAFVVALYAGVQVSAVAQSDLGEQMQRSMDPVIVDKVDINTAPYEQLLTLPGMSSAVANAIVERRAQRPLTSLDEVSRLEALTDMQRTDIDEARGNVVGLDAQASVGGGALNWFGTVSQILMLLGLLASLIYFYFSMEHRGVVGKISRFGVWILMIGFGASFGYTVQGRLSLAIGRALDVLGRDKDPVLAEHIHGSWVALVSIVVLVVGLVVWELTQRRPAGGGGPDGGTAAPTGGAGPDASH